MSGKQGNWFIFRYMRLNGLCVYAGQLIELAVSEGCIGIGNSGFFRIMRYRLLKNLNKPWRVLYPNS